MSYLKSLAKNKFNGSEKKARAWLKANGQRGGVTGVKHFAKVSSQTRRKYALKGAKESARARRLKNNPYDDENLLEALLEEN